MTSFWRLCCYLVTLFYCWLWSVNCWLGLFFVVLMLCTCQNPAGKTLQFAICSTYFSFFFFSIKKIFWHFLCPARCEICSKLKIKTPGYVKLIITIKWKIKTWSTSFWPPYCQLWKHFTSVDFDQLIASWGCCLLFWHFVPAGINLAKVFTFGETR